MAIFSWVKKFSQLSLMVGAAAAVIGVTVPTHAYTIFFGEDLNNNPDSPLSSFPNAQTAAGNFLSRLTGTGIETFDSFAPRTSVPLTLTFPGGKTATLEGSGSISNVTPGRTNGVGRYAISGSNYWEANAEWGQFSITFNQSVVAFGFYGIDIGDFGGQLVLNLIGESTRQVTVSNTVGTYGSTDG
ncbi:MAG TPA: PEP-CTERM sorting domain-containing protein, partial [Cyanobacteria bacterium UBA8553]|nr:PEP-CTERM sorting domain-containing protein [Cyanobacteria bacterium UBA8553]